MWLYMTFEVDNIILIKPDEVTKFFLSKMDPTVTDKYVLFYSNEFSNFHPCHIVAYGQTFSSTEQVFMWKKAKEFGDETMATNILNTSDPGQAKKYGRRVKNYNEQRWDAIREKVMRDACWLKYTTNQELQDLLLSFGNRTFAQASSDDEIWGIGLDLNDPLAADEANWTGQNLLGRVLTSIRDEILQMKKDGKKTIFLPGEAQ